MHQRTHMPCGHSPICTVGTSISIFETMYWNDRLLTCWGKQPSVNKEKTAKSFTLSFKVKKQRRTDVLFLSACLQRWSARPLRSLWSAFSSCSSALCSAISATSGLIAPSWPLSPESSLSCQVIGFIFRKSNIKMWPENIFFPAVLWICFVFSWTRWVSWLSLAISKI